ncbi:MAG: hypothetical protein UMU76_08195 [Prosthecochloris sp.]|nr:hypothetical protein [Prosthecochloris sp.]
MKQTVKKLFALVLLVQLIFSPMIALAQQPFGSSLYSSPSNSYSSFNQQNNQPAMPGYGMPLDTYFTDSMGNILMYVNVLGEVYESGQHIIRQDADISTVLSLVGGPTDDANLEKAKLMRYKPEEDGTQIYEIDLETYFEEGDRSQFVELKPNDTLLIPEDKSLDTNDVLRIAGLLVSVASVIAIASN